MLIVFMFFFLFFFFFVFFIFFFFKQKTAYEIMPSLVGSEMCIRDSYYDYPIGPRFFRFKHWLIKTFAHQDNAIVVELQAEPWIKGWTTSGPLDEQFKSMNPQKLEDNVEFARKVD